MFLRILVARMPMLIPHGKIAKRKPARGELEGNTRAVKYIGEFVWHRIVFHRNISYSRISKTLDGSQGVFGTSTSFFQSVRYPTFLEFPKQYDSNKNWDLLEVKNNENFGIYFFQRVRYPTFLEFPKQYDSKRIGIFLKLKIIGVGSHGP